MKRQNNDNIVNTVNIEIRQFSVNPVWQKDAENQETGIENAENNIKHAHILNWMVVPSQSTIHNPKKRIAPYHMTVCEVVCWLESKGPPSYPMWSMLFSHVIYVIVSEIFQVKFILFDAREEFFAGFFFLIFAF